MNSVGFMISGSCFFFLLIFKKVILLQSNFANNRLTYLIYFPSSFHTNPTKHLIDGGSFDEEHLELKGNVGSILLSACNGVQGRYAKNISKYYFVSLQNM